MASANRELFSPERMVFNFWRFLLIAAEAVDLAACQQSPKPYPSILRAGTMDEESSDSNPVEEKPIHRQPGFGWTILFSGALILVVLVQTCIWLQLLNQPVLILLTALMLIWAVTSVYFIEANCTRWARRK